MKKIAIWALAAATILVSLSGCVRENMSSDGEPGSVIVFGADAEFDGFDLTRTEFSGKDENGGGITSTSKYERVDWIAGKDRIRILCDAATGGELQSGKAGDYSIKSGSVTTSAQKSLASIESIEKNSLRWGTGDHYFYAYYPAPDSESNYNFTYKKATEANSSIVSAGNNKATVTGVIPAEQEVVKVGNEFKANMNYEYMYAGTKPARVGTNVTLSFHPLVTNLEFTLMNDASYPVNAKLTKVVLSSTESTLTGSFTATLSMNASGVATAAASATGTPGNTVTVNIPDGGVTLTSTPVKLNIITLPLAQTKLTLTLWFGNDRREIDLKKSGNWITVPACKKAYFNNIAVPGSLWDYYLDPIADVVLTDAESGPGAIKPIQVKCYRVNRTNPSIKEEVPWTAYALKTGTSDTFVKHGSSTGWPTWTYLNKYTGTGSITGQTVDVYVAQESFTDAVAKDVVTKGDGKGMIAALKNATPVGSETRPRDLSLYSLYGNLYPDSYLPSITKAGAHTANCYVVSAPGHYCFPIVYGNAIDMDRGNATTGVYNNAYKSQNTSLGNYRNADNKPIQSPYILEDSNLKKPTNLEAIVLWQDMTVGFRILDDGVPYDGDPWPLRIVDAPSGAGLQGHKYIQFYLAPKDMKPGNILIALRDHDTGKVLWNWHIWVTTTQHSQESNYFAIRNIKYRSNLSSPSTLADIKMLHCPIGWTPPLSLPERSTTGRRTKMRIVPDYGTAEPVTFNVIQGGITSPKYVGKYYSHTVYQWGRKDPFIGSSGETVYKNKSFFSHYYDFVTLGNTDVVFFEEMNKKVDDWISRPYMFDGSKAVPFQRYDLWNSNNKNNEFNSSSTSALFQQAVKKTIYDPCPAGFSVPKASAYTGFTTNGKTQSTYAGEHDGQPLETVMKYWCGKKVDADDAAGRPGSFMFSYNASRTTSTYTFYIPGSGYRHPSTPSLMMQAYHGNVWVATPKTDHIAWDFDWDPDQVDPLHSNETYGFGVYPTVEQ